MNKDIIEWASYFLTFVGFIATIAKTYEVWSGLKKFTWNDVEKYSMKIIKSVTKDGYYPDIIVGIGRGGAIIGSILSGNLPTEETEKKHNITFLGVDRMYEWRGGKRVDVENQLIDFTPLRGMKIMLVASDVMTGNTMGFYRSKLLILGDETEVKTTALVRSKNAAMKIDYVGKHITSSFSMPWMFKNCNYCRDSRTDKQDWVGFREKY